MGREAQTTIEFEIRAPIVRADLPGLCDRLGEVLAAVQGASVICDVSGIDADAVAVDALARLQLGARQQGCQVRLRGASRPLRELIAFIGLKEVLPE
jgi:ABC-type transporter Mla MlaB component